MLTLLSSSSASQSPASGSHPLHQYQTRFYRNRPISSSSPTSSNPQSYELTSSSQSHACENQFCFCGRRRLISTAAAALIPIHNSFASNSSSGYEDVLNRIRPPKPDWYEEMFAMAMDASMKPYEAQIAGFKSELFAELKGKINEGEEILELGIGTGPNLKYYANAGLRVVGVDPNVKMEKYAKAAAVAAGLQLAKFDFRQAVGEALPLADASVDAVVGTLVLCSVRDIDKTLSEVRRVLKPGGIYVFIEHVAATDGTFLKLVQSLLDPLQQALADGCHLTRETGQNISRAGFSQVNLNTAFVGSDSLIAPHVYGIARK